jgi:hypothetical protein
VHKAFASITERRLPSGADKLEGLDYRLPNNNEREMAKHKTVITVLPEPFAPRMIVSGWKN